MNIDLNTLPIENNRAEQQFEAHVDGHVAFISYGLFDKKIIFTHTEVPPALRGQGIAEKLAETVLNYARDHNLGVVPRCQFVASYIRKNGEYKSLVVKE